MLKQELREALSSEAGGQGRHLGKFRGWQSSGKVSALCIAYKSSGRKGGREAQVDEAVGRRIKRRIKEVRGGEVTRCGLDLKLT